MNYKLIKIERYYNEAQKQERERNQETNLSGMRAKLTRITTKSATRAKRTYKHRSSIATKCI
jgi:hypothetical protein